jgi:hypothetical protein
MVVSFFAFVICGCSDPFLATCNANTKNRKDQGSVFSSSGMPVCETGSVLFAVRFGRRTGKDIWEDIFHTPEYYTSSIIEQPFGIDSGRGHG